MTIPERKLWIHNQFVAGAQVQPVLSPYTGEPVTQIHLADAALLSEAIDSAERAFETALKSLPAYQRAEILNRAAELIGQRETNLATAMMLEAGKPIQTARAEVGRAVSTFRVSAQEALNLHGEQIPMDLTAAGVGRIALTVRQPIGVIGAITPFNFPLNLVAHKVAPAIAAGNTIVLKPPSNAPSAALILAELLAEAGLPAGGLNVVPCPGAVAEQLATDPRIAMIAFTGSAPVGHHLHGLAKGKKVSLELGSMSPVLIHSDADLATAARKCSVGGYAYSGQVCISVQRILVQAEVYEAFKQAYLPLVEALPVGDPSLPDTVVGPLIRSKEVERLEQWVGEAQAAGAKVLVGGKRLEHNCYAPTVLEEVPAGTTLSCSEVFGPITVLERYDRFEEAIQLANAVPYPGLNAGVFTESHRLALKAGLELSAGGVLINEVPTWRVDHMPYGGHGQSGLGREGPRYAVEEMTEIKLIVFNS
ncbi:aldehyde dehydrogenase family protein [Leptolyngbya sp. FACHB-261]|uniref:aldehyde dehydrogenase family protein n=1 Tax=Leptolyngbya sp. FACHB-261 TaxID=2692806 RepID=UPI001682DC31|nr:aldehyde dehydrogenase family protein [Leptolyngbya sp. FACHB-261]MBD2101358.1 aldehyde dehydrogenase family protein [Leptolyngbya sp. FACHB-261]